MFKNNNKIKYIFLLQFGVIIYSTASVVGKFASTKALFSLPFLLLYFAEFVILAIYAILWQQMLKNMDVSIAYANRSMALLWATLWAPLIFKEQITSKNILGVACIIVGTILINTVSSKKEANP